MEWSDSGIVLAARPHGETSAIIEVLTAENGRHAGLRSEEHTSELQSPHAIVCRLLLEKKKREG